MRAACTSTVSTDVSSAFGTLLGALESGTSEAGTSSQPSAFGSARSAVDTSETGISCAGRALTIGAATVETSMSAESTAVSVSVVGGQTR